MKHAHATAISMVVAFAAAASLANAHMRGASAAPAPKHAARDIALAMSAGPAAITRNATIVTCGGSRCADMNDMAKGQMTQLRSGTNGWVCYAFSNEPMCLDPQWQKWMAAIMVKGEPKIDGTGIAYMLRGDKGGSNTDPFATAPTADNQWVIAPPHVMVLFQDARMLDAYPTDPKSGGPWVMWKGTPYAHVMVPVAPATAAKVVSP